MRLIAILFLCSRLLPSLTQEPDFQEADCNDKDVFEAVDAALKKYNSRNQSGNQFVLVRTTEVNKTVNHDVFYSVKYEVKEGDCPVQSNKTWQDCDYKDAEEAATGECTATVGKRRNDRFVVATQTCSITPAGGPVVTTEYACLGCVHPISTKSPELEPILTHTIQHFNNNTQHTYLFTLGEVKRAQRQVVRGWNYEITYSIIQTNCSKEKFLLLSPECKSLPNGDAGECVDNAFMDPQWRLDSFSQKCELYPGQDFVEPPVQICLGCPRHIPMDSPELQEVLTHSIKKLNAENNETFHFKIETVKRATVQVLAGKKFAIEFTASETTCSKESNQELTRSCETKNPGKRLTCNADVYVVPWEKKIYPTVHCETLGKMTLMKRPPGFSPFRTAQIQKTEETTVSPPYTSMAPVQDEEQDPEKKQEPTPGHGWGHERQTKHGLGHGHIYKHGLGHGHQKQHGLGHGHQQQHGLGHGYQPELDYDLKHQREHGLDHGHKNKHKHGHSHGKHRNKDKSNGKHNDQRTEHLASSSEDSTTSSTQTEAKTEGPTPTPFLAQPGVAVTVSGFQDSDLVEAVMPTMSPTSTENDDDWIPDIPVEPDSLPFKLIPDFPETTSPKCPGHPWKPVDSKPHILQMIEFRDFDLFEALN
ncbi:kininogen-1 [Erethizon dorsatum]